MVIGEADEVDGYALAGAYVVAASDAEPVRTAWASLPPDTGLVLLSSRAAWLLERADVARKDQGPLVVVIGG